ncbi:hypothetical protein XBKQ1_280010 [Xenorhabdus bovienii str. kraussei Quebec]|uniref:Uncharacterized protein n=1 Tax=Xenorhabdus bovienii str. kraussei Quebec TaxID=1398203 RepID=A0A077PM52_XENBV|nr:hypothetical protein XBKQ1_280010 [Xenorhabdus bovienii str. kraussei Quebec]
MARDYAYIVLMCLVPEGKKSCFFTVCSIFDLQWSFYSLTC